MPLRGKGAIAIWNGLAADGEDDFYRWHNTEHMPERVGVPGFLRGRRYLSTPGPGTSSRSTRPRASRRSGARPTSRG
jgi:hypothetical protein